MIKKLFLLILPLGIVLACNNENEANYTDKNSLSVSDFREYGELHNALMDNINDNFEVPPVTASASADAFVESICESNANYISSQLKQNGNNSDIIVDIYKYKNLLNIDNIAQHSTSSRSSRSTDSKLTPHYLDSIFSQEVIDVESLPNLNDIADVLYEEKLISKTGYSLLTELVSAVHDNSLGLCSDAVFEKNVYFIMDKYNKTQYDTLSVEGKNIGTALAITKSSMEWWREHPEAYTSGTDTKAWPAAVAADVAGALYGVVANLVCGNKVTLSGVAISAAGASLGATAKIVSFFKDIIKLLRL